MKPYYKRDGIEIYHADCREVLPQIAGADLVLTDPPYGMNWNFSGQGSGKAPQGGRSSRFAAVSVFGDDRDFDPSFLLGFPHVILWGFHHYPNRLTRGSVLVWIKKRAPAYGSFLSDADLAWMKGGCGVYLSETINPASFQKEREHPTQKPVALMAWCIEKSRSTGLILDPFIGSGTTLVAARDLGRRAIGIEIEERYCEIAAKRLDATAKPKAKAA